ncbi:hypothetical protein GCM10017562_18220 [Streptomyces roseofulvus]
MRDGRLRQRVEGGDTGSRSGSTGGGGAVGRPPGDEAGRDGPHPNDRGDHPRNALLHTGEQVSSAGPRGPVGTGPHGLSTPLPTRSAGMPTVWPEAVSCCH